MAAELSQLGVPQEYRDRAKMLWILTLLGAFWGWIICNFIWKIEGQEQNQWYQFQLKQSLYAGLLGVVTFGLGSFILGLLGFLAINKGEDYEAPVIGGMARK